MQNLYVANQVDKNIVHFAVAANGVLTKKDSVTLATTPVGHGRQPRRQHPLRRFWNILGNALGLTRLSSGALAPPPTQLNLTIPGFATDSVVPTGVTVLANGKAVFVTAYDLSAYNPGGITTSTASPGWMFGFTTGSGGALTPTPGSPYNAGVKPTALAADPTNRYVYVTDFASNQLIGYGIYTGYALNFLLNGPYKTGGQPTSVAIDPRGKFIYVSNSLDSSVTAYVIDLPDWYALGRSQHAPARRPTPPIRNRLSIAVDPALGRYVYTANFLGNSVSGFRLDPTAGTLKQTQATPYPTGIHPTAVVLVPHGNHSTQIITP